MYKINSLKIFAVLLFVLYLSSCTKDPVTPTPIEPTNAKYIYVSHTRTDSNPNLDSIIEEVDYSSFDMLWLGGDLAKLSSQDDETMLHIDSIFNVGDENTLWALGNHDYTDLDRIREFTNRPPYYAYYKNGITFIIIDTQDSLSSIVGYQKELFESVVDSINLSTHLVIIHHKLIWMYDNAYLEPLIPSVSNAELGDCFYCINPNNFYTDIYPGLLEVRQKGIEVLCIGGDIGFNAKEFEYLTPEGIHFLASGVSAGEDDNKVLVFYHDIVNNDLTWEFILTSDL